MFSVTYAEKAFMQLMARRLLRYQRDAAARGEAYHDISPFSPLQCGALAKLRFEESPGGYNMVAILRSVPALSATEHKEIAADILGEPVILRKAVGDDLEYVRAKDAGVVSPP
jgi:hypothetical protein